MNHKMKGKKARQFFPPLHQLEIIKIMIIPDFWGGEIQSRLFINLGIFLLGLEKDSGIPVSRYHIGTGSDHILTYFFFKNVRVLFTPLANDKKFSRKI